MCEESLGQFLKDRGYIFIQMSQNAVGHFEIGAQIDGHEVAMLVDTGASKTVLHNESAERIGIQNKEIDNCGAGIGTASAAVGTALTNVFTLGELEITDFPLYIMDFGHVLAGMKAKGGHLVDGVVGADILGSRSAIIDYKGAKLYLKAVAHDE